MTNRYLGYGLIILATIIGFVFYVMQKSLNEIMIFVCLNKEICSIKNNNFETIFMYLIVFILIGYGLYLILFGKEGFFILKKTQKEVENVDIVKKEILNKLSYHEKEIYDKIVENNGEIYQSELVKISGFSKVRITRILDRLESRNLIERHRKGMTNLVLLKKEIKN